MLFHIFMYNLIKLNLKDIEAKKCVQHYSFIYIQIYVNTVLNQLHGFFTRVRLFTFHVMDERRDQ